MAKKFVISSFLIFTIITIHCICSVAIYANPPTSAEMEVKAQIVVPAQIEVIKSIDFGRLLAGTRNNRAFGQYRVRFDSDADISIEYAGIELDSEEAGQIFLRNTENKATLPVRLAIRKGEKTEANDNSKRSQYLIDINGVLDVPNGTPRGMYKENIVASIKYN
ncbi:hypothetical protein [Cetobacterium sp.]|uniref:hypothetical protein n=1 Tax=Cetobacterium sp. TaxID=2071632 RepID=UPI003F2C6355